MTTGMYARCSRAALACACMLALCGQAPRALADVDATITLNAPAQVDAGDTFSFLISIDGTVPLIGYSLVLAVFPDAGATGTMIGDHSATNFYDSENLIVQGGGGLHPTLSTIGPLGGNPGLGVTGIDQTLTATAVPGPGQNILAEVFFDVSSDASGSYTLELSNGTGLADNNLEEVDWTADPVTITIPEPGYLGIMGGIALAVLRRRRTSA